MPPTRAPHASLALALAALLALAAASAAPGARAAHESGEPMRLAVLGETHGVRNETHQLVHQLRERGATGVLSPGDFIYGHEPATPEAWKEMMAPLQPHGVLPAFGNHDWDDYDAWVELFPNGSLSYTTTLNGVRLVVVNSEYSLTPESEQGRWLRDTLNGSDERLKVVMLHRPWWLPEGAIHPASEFAEKTGANQSQMDALMAEHNVSLVIAGHEKNYQRSVRDGVVYLVHGSAGAPDFAPLDYELPGAQARFAHYAGTLMEASPHALRLSTWNLTGDMVDSFTITSGAHGDPGNGSGNESDDGPLPKVGGPWWNALEAPMPGAALAALALAAVGLALRERRGRR